MIYDTVKNYWRAAWEDYLRRYIGDKSLRTNSEYLRLLIIIVFSILLHCRASFEAPKMRFRYQFCLARSSHAFPSHQRIASNWSNEKSQNASRVHSFWNSTCEVRTSMWKVRCRSSAEVKNLLLKLKQVRSIFPELSWQKRLSVVNKRSRWRQTWVGNSEC